MTGKYRPLVFRIGMALCAFIFLLFFARYASPLMPRENGWDAAFFRLVGQRMTEGCLPYRDFFDMKGPYLFFLEYISQMLIYGRMGAFLLEWVSLTLALLLVCRIFDRLGIRKYATRLLLMLPCLWMAAGTFEGGNLTEELSLPALFLCLDLWLGHYLDRGAAGYHPPRDAAVYGACFMFLALIRVTNAALIGALVLSLCVELISCRRLKCLGLNALAFIGGAAAVFLPMYMYYASYGLAEEMLYQVFVFGYKYGSEYGLLSSLSRALNHPHHFFFLLLPALLVPVYRIRDCRLALPALFASLFTVFACIPGNQYTHYLTIGIPLIVLAEIIILLNRGKLNLRWRRNRIAALLMAVAMLLHIQTTGGSVLYSCRLLFIPGFTVETGVEDVALHIEDSEKDRVFCYNTGPFWYLASGINPYIRYSGWHKHYISLNPEIASELEMLLEKDPPSCIVIRAGQSLPPFMSDLLDNRYHETYRNDQYVLHKINALPAA